MTLREQQSLFVSLVAQLIGHAYAQGYELTFGEAYRPVEQAVRMAAEGKGIKRSLHTDRLAIDLHLFKDGVWLTSTEAHTPLGVWWETLHPSCRWGGRFSKPDGNHYSLAYDGRA